MTRRLVHYIARDSLIRTFADVARDVAVDVQTVRGVFQDFSEWLRENHPIATPRIMGIDEAKRAKVLCTVLTDLERREYFDMLPSRKAKPLNDYLRKMPDKDRVEVVAMDLHQGFVTAIARHMPKAIRVADRYHIARLAQNAFDKAHVAARKELPTGERLAMFRKRGLLALRDRRLTESERAQVAAVLSPFPLLLATYESKEAFLTIYEAKDRQQEQDGNGGFSARAVRCSKAIGGRRFNFFEQAALQLAFGLLEIGGGKRSFGIFPLKFGQLVAENGEIGFLAVSAGFGRAQAEPQRGQNEGGNHHDQQGGKDGELGHFWSISLSSASARLASSADRGWSSALIRVERRRR